MQVDSDPAGIRAARRFVERQVLARGGSAIAEEANLVAAELLANAVQHGRAPVTVDVRAQGELIRVEVRDADSRPPVRAARGVTANMTGRGLALVDAIANRWGVEQVPGDGKVVWAEFDPTALPSAGSHTERRSSNAVGDWHEPVVTGGEPRYTVVLGDVPTDLLIEAKAHIDNLVREFTLMASAVASGVVTPTEHLAGLIRAVVTEFAEARDSIKRQALTAAGRRQPRTQLSLTLPESAAAAGEAYLLALDEADAYARAARLLTLETPPAHRLFRRWYVEAVVRQLRDRAAGREPSPVEPFEARMLREIERLAILQRITDRAARLQRVTAALANTRTPEDVAFVVVSEGVAALDASGGGLLVPAPDGVHLAVPGTVGYGEEFVGALRDERLDAPLPAASVLRTGEPVWLESMEERDQLFPELRGFEGATVSMCSVPLIVADRILGALRFSFATRRLFDEDERAFVLALAAQTAQTLLRTESYAAERKASLDLQRALLPSSTPIIPGWEVAAYYSPAGQVEAGGDFYDVLPVGDGRLAAIVGDVMGRGVEAAAAMAQVRTLIRAYAVDDPCPDRVLTRVDTFFDVVDLAQFVTALYFLIDPASNEVKVGNAGHLPPIVVTASGSHLADVPAGRPLGVPGPARTSTTLVVEPGTSVVVITDGLVERRGEDIDEGIRRVLEAANAPAPSVRQLLDRIVATAAVPGLHDDDVTVLALRNRREGDRDRLPPAVSAQIVD